jgi:hypothetical protein
MAVANVIHHLTEVCFSLCFLALFAKQFQFQAGWNDPCSELLFEEHTDYHQQRAHRNAELRGSDPPKLLLGTHRVTSPRRIPDNGFGVQEPRASAHLNQSRCL